MFTSNDNFIVPNGVSTIRVIAVGGGGCGMEGYLSGGGGGYVECGTFAVTGGTPISIDVGRGGRSLSSTGTGIREHTYGFPSSFGTLLSAGGGSACYLEEITSSQMGCSGGSGSGANCYLRCFGGSYAGNGGSNGSSGGINSRSDIVGVGEGIEKYSNCLRLAAHNKLTAGKGGDGGLTLSYNNYQMSFVFGASGGGGGVLINGQGPQTPAENGTPHTFSCYSIAPNIACSAIQISF